MEAEEGRVSHLRPVFIILVKLTIALHPLLNLKFAICLLVSSPLVIQPIGLCYN